MDELKRIASKVRASGLFELADEINALAAPVEKDKTCPGPECKHLHDAGPNPDVCPTCGCPQNCFTRGDSCPADPAPASEVELAKEYDCLIADPSAEQPCGDCAPCLSAKKTTDPE